MKHTRCQSMFAVASFIRNNSWNVKLLFYRANFASSLLQISCRISDFNCVTTRSKFTIHASMLRKIYTIEERLFFFVEGKIENSLNARISQKH